MKTRGFDSKKEADRYDALRFLELSGEIEDLRLQVSFDLHVGATVIGRYVADFTYVGRASMDEGVPTGVKVVEDCKGFRTRIYRWKKKHFEAEYGVRILET